MTSWVACWRHALVTVLTMLLTTIVFFDHCTRECGKQSSCERLHQWGVELMHVGQVVVQEEVDKCGDTPADDNGGCLHNQVLLHGQL